MRIGSRGPDVFLLQEGLRRAGLPISVVDGVFGMNTYNALVSFQIQNGLTPDGVFGSLSYNSLYPYLVGYVIHTIRANDTLFSLSQIYNTSVNSIITSNQNIDPYNLVIGMQIVIPLGFSVTYTNIPFTTTVLELCIEGLTKRYPFIEVMIIGKSILGNNIYNLKIGEGVDEVMYNASHHANEWITTPILVKFLEDFSLSYSTSSKIFNQDSVSIFNKTTINIVPMVNPDGVDLVTGLIKPNSNEYLNALSMNTSLPFPSGWKANIRGVDLNLNYPAKWLEARNIKFSQGITKPGPRDYVGQTPLSEPESIALSIFTLQHHFRLTLSYHSQGEVIFWKFLDFNPPNSYEIAQAFSEVSGYAVEITPYESGYAGYKDWFIQTYNLPGYTIEVGRGINPLPISDFNYIYESNIGILVLASIKY